MPLRLLFCAQEEAGAEDVISKHMIRRTLEESGVMTTKLATRIVYLEMNPDERKLHDIYLANGEANTIAGITKASQICSTGVDYKQSSTKVMSNALWVG